MINRLREVLSYDAETGKISWKVQLAPRGKIGSEAGCSSVAYTSQKRRISIRVDGKLLLAHRIAWMIHHGVEPKGQIDHIDGDPTNNRITNLRVATNAENGRNRGASSRNKSGWKGVSWNGKRQKWVAQIGVNGKRIGLGRFGNVKEAAEAYIFAAIEHHGEYARFE